MAEFFLVSLILLVYLQMIKVVPGDYLRFTDKVHHVDNICEAFFV